MAEIKKQKSNEKKSKLHNIETIFKANNIIIEFFDDYYSMVAELNINEFMDKKLKC